MTDRTAAEQAAEVLREAIEVLALSDPEGKRAAHIHAPEDEEIGSLCERVGYGAVMDSAARLWRRKDAIGAHTTGAAALTVKNTVARLNEALRALTAESARVSPDREALEEDDAAYERRLSDEEAADNLRLLDWIADKIGLPKDEELSRENFAAWLASPAVGEWRPITAQQVRDWLASRPGVSWTATLQDVDDAIDAIRSPAPPQETKP